MMSPEALKDRALSEVGKYAALELLPTPFGPTWDSTAIIFAREVVRLRELAALPGAETGWHEEKAKLEKHIDFAMLPTLERQGEPIDEAVVECLSRLRWQLAELQNSETGCEWREDDNGIWHTDCGHTFFFDTDGPTENKQKYCGYCGAALVPSPFRESQPAGAPPEPPNVKENNQ